MKLSLGKQRRSGLREELMSGVKERPSSRGTVRWASASTSRWVRPWGEGGGLLIESQDVRS